jgi:hypothetical protein
MAHRAREKAREVTLRALAMSRSASAVRIDPEELATRRDAATVDAAAAIAAANLRHLAMADRLDAAFEKLCDQIMAALADDAGSVSRKPPHRLAGGLAAAVTTATRLANTIQAIERTALGMHHDLPSRRSACPPSAEAVQPAAPRGLTDAQLLALLRSADRTEADKPACGAGSRLGGDGLPLPPAFVDPQHECHRCAAGAG